MIPLKVARAEKKIAWARLKNDAGRLPALARASRAGRALTGSRIAGPDLSWEIHGGWEREVTRDNLEKRRYAATPFRR